MDGKQPEVPKDRIDALLRLADASWRDFDQRRSYEWKLNFGLWPALGIFAGYMLRDAKPLPYEAKTGLTVLLGLTWLVYVFPWSYGLQRRNRMNQDSARRYWTEVENLIHFRTDHESDREKDPPGSLLLKCGHASARYLLHLLLLP